MNPSFGKSRRALIAWSAASVCLACSVDTAGTGSAAMDPIVPSDASALGQNTGEKEDAGDNAVGQTSDASSDASVAADEAGAWLDADVRVDAAGDAAPLDDAALVDASRPHDAHVGDANLPPGSCDLSGRYAVDLLFDVSWNETTLAGIVPLLQGGTGQIHITLQVDLSGPPATMNATLGACGATLPDFAASNALIGTEDYSAYFLESAWDQPEMPHTDFGARFGCSTPGCALNLDRVVATFGARSDPGDVWPGRTGDITQIVPVDHDGDHYPAMSVYTRGSTETNAQGTEYLHIPVTWTLGARATRAAVPFRVVANAIGRIDSCDSLSGAIASGSVEARALACRAIASNSTKEVDCTADQADFLDQNLPDWTVNGGSFRAKRIARDADCAASRAAWQ